MVSVSRRLNIVQEKERQANYYAEIEESENVTLRNRSDILAEEDCPQDVEGGLPVDETREPSVENSNIRYLSYVFCC